MTREPDPTGFDEIVASWRAEGNVPEWPDELRLDDDQADVDPLAGPDVRAEGGPGAGADPGTDEAGSGRSDAAASPLGPSTDSTDRSATGHPDDDRPGTNRSGGGPDDRPGVDGPGTNRPGIDEPGAGRPGVRPAPPSADGPGVDPTGGPPRRSTDPHADDRRDPTGRERSPVTRPAADPLADEHFVPPEPPPLPRMGPPILIGLLLITLGLVLVTFPGWVGVPQVYGLPLGLVAIAAGLGWLVLRLWPDPDDVPPPLYLDDPDDPDGGAVL